jgi:hypothetical protein
LPSILANKVGGKISNIENRYLAKFPRLITENKKLATEIQSGIENWISDNLKGRTKLSKSEVIEKAFQKSGLDFFI